MTALPPMLLWVVPHTGNPAALVLVGANPPWNQPQVMCRAFSRSPMFLPVTTARGLVEVWLEGEQPLKAGSGCPSSLPRPLLFSVLTPPGSGTLAPVVGSTANASPVLPEMTLSAPGVDGPNTVS